jgi:hypothetical protein
MRSCSRPTDWKASSSTATIRTLSVTNPGFVERAKQFVSLVISGTGGTLGSNTPGLGIRSCPENRSPLVPSAYRFSSNHGQTQKSLIGKERGALRAFSLGRTVPASQQASAEDRDGPLAMQVLFLVPHRR